MFDQTDDFRVMRIMRTSKLYKAINYSNSLHGEKFLGIIHPFEVIPFK